MNRPALIAGLALAASALLATPERKSCRGGRVINPLMGACKYSEARFRSRRRWLRPWRKAISAANSPRRSRSCFPRSRGWQRRCPQLPNTAELNAVAKDVDATDADIHLGCDASETTLKRAALAQYGIINFATHGLFAATSKDSVSPRLHSRSRSAIGARRRPSHCERSHPAQAECGPDCAAVDLQHIAGDKAGPWPGRDWRARSSMPVPARFLCRIER